MEPTAIGETHGPENRVDAAIAGVAATNASVAPARLQPSILGDAQSTALAQLAGSIALAAASLPPGAMQVSTSVPDAHAGDVALPAHQPDILRPLPSVEKQQLLDQSPWLGTTELLPPARLVEVAHAALQSSGFRRRLGSGPQQALQQDPPQLQSEVSAGSGTPWKRERQVHDGDGTGNGDLKRQRSDPGGAGGAPEEPAQPMPGTSAVAVADAVARITPPSAAAIACQHALQPPSSLPLPPLALAGTFTAAVPPAQPLKREPAASSSTTSPLARPQPRHFSSTGTESTAVPRSDGAAAPPVLTSGLANGPIKSAFQAASLITEWQPGCSVTTGRRSARSPAARGNRSLGAITRAASLDASSGPLSRRGSGYVAGAVGGGTAAAATGTGAAAALGGIGLPQGDSDSAAVSPNSHNAAAVPAGAAAVAVPGASATAEQAARGGVDASASALEAAGSADLRRLAQLAEAAAMLEEQLASEDGTGDGAAARGACTGLHHHPGSAAAANGRPAAAAATAAARGDHDDARAAAAGAGVGVGEPLSLRHRAGSVTAGGLPTRALSGTGSGGSGSAACGAAGAREPPTQLFATQQLGPSSSAQLRPLGSLTLPGRMGPGTDLQHRGGGRGPSGGTAREGSPSAGGGGGGGGGGEEEGTAGSRLRCGQLDHESGGGSPDNGCYRGGDELEDGDADGDEDEHREGSNDSAGGGTFAGVGGGAGGRTLTERYRAALKASAAQQRGRGVGNGGSKHDADKSSRSVRNGVCARIASITKERLQQVYHLNIEEAARELGIGMTKLKEHCRTLGIPRWPSRKLKSMDKLIESLNERAMTEPATKEVIADILAEIEQFKRAIYENPCLEVEEDIKRLRQSNFKKEYQQRQVEQRLRLGSSDRPVGSGGAGGVAGGGVSGGISGGISGGRSSSAGPVSVLVTAPPQSQQGALREDASGSPSTVVSMAAAAAAAAVAATGASAALAAPPGRPAGLGVGLTPALVPGQLPAAGAAAAAASSASAPQLVLSQALPGQMPGLLSPGLQQLLMASSPPAAAATLQQLMAQRALGAMPPTAAALLLPPSMLPGQYSQAAKPLAALAAVGEAAAAAGGCDGGGSE